MKNNNNTKGFTLVEILMATAIFSILSVTICGIFINASNLQVQISNYQKLQNDGRYITEKIAKELRSKDVVLPYPANNPTSSISFWPDEAGNKVRIYFDSSTGSLIYEKNGQGAELNSLDVKVANVDFFVYPVQDPFNINVASATPDIQPRITLLLEIVNKNTAPKYKKRLILQTTISSREYKR
ncbi:MAG: prepilin-type N-terminal cleavage/methylation domain-containing protein [Patescibacteria group bacterium]|jgi:prepilin-type N-terminal cleavage/methylation domain-containing protein